MAGRPPDPKKYAKPVLMLKNYFLLRLSALLPLPDRLRYELTRHPLAEWPAWLTPPIPFARVHTGGAVALVSQGPAERHKR